MPTKQPTATGWFSAARLGVDETSPGERQVIDEALDWAQETGRISAASRPGWAFDMRRDPTATLAVLKRLHPTGAGSAGGGLLDRRPGGLFGGAR